MFITKLLLVFLALTSAKSESACNQMKNCRDCIQYSSFNCIWCSEVLDNITDKEVRCKSAQEVRGSHWCEHSREDPMSNIKIVKNIQSVHPKEGKKHFFPQKIDMATRVGVPMKFNLTYKLSTDYKLDLYFLMDFSISMAPHQKTLKNQTDMIGKKLSNVTSNVRLGFGGFVEKPALPYGLNGHSFSFQNFISLTDNYTEFKNKATFFTSFNYDDPECALDALMQVLTCKDEIGWQDTSLRFVVVFNDGTMHFAGDGKIVGAYKPNDMQCHMKNNRYRTAITYDYPSLSQIDKIARDKNIRIIFASSESVYKAYEGFSKRVYGSAATKLDENIADMIVNEYTALLRYPQLVLPTLPPYVRVNLNPPCDEQNKPECIAEHYEEKNAEVTVTLTSCPPNLQEEIDIAIGIVGIDEKMIINIKPLCQCNCEASGSKDTFKSSQMCSDHGIYQCGTCRCDDEWSGPTCNCESRFINNTEICKSYNGLPCHGLGQCRCGKCECQGSSGKLCEFDDKLCPYPGGVMCAGNGQCSLGKCSCNPQWTGDDCTCTKDNRDCIAPYSTEICSGKGLCECGVCKCTNDKDESSNSEAVAVSGIFCDNSKERCSQLEGIVKCLYNKKINNDSQECLNIQTLDDDEVQFVSKIEMEQQQFELAWNCKIPIEKDKSIVYKIQYSPDKQISFIIQKETDVSSKPNVWVVAGSVIGSIVLIGLVTVLIWRVLIEIHDRKEYRKFCEAEKEAINNLDNATMNPCFKEANVLYKNPAFKRKSFYQN